jgi:Agrobacterium tumefaciens protein Atu4866
VPQYCTDEAPGPRQYANTEDYKVTGIHISCQGDCGFAADGEFAEMNTLHQGGMVFRREA